MTFESFVQTELPLRPFTSDDGAAGQVPVRSSNPLAAREMVWVDPATLIGAAQGRIEVNFSFGDATPLNIALIPAGKVIFRVELYITSSFDGVGAQLMVGDAGQLDSLMAPDEIDVQNMGANQTNPSYAYGTDTQVLLSITPGSGATQGAGVLVLVVQQ